jgi:hypothetical protein
MDEAGQITLPVCFLSYTDWISIRSWFF